MIRTRKLAQVSNGTCYGNLIFRNPGNCARPCSRFRHNELNLNSFLHRDGRCQPFFISRRDLVGNVMLASRPISASEVILEERPAAFGPASKANPVCLECLEPWDREKNGRGFVCYECKFPLCGEKCESSLEKSSPFLVGPAPMRGGGAVQVYLIWFREAHYR